MQEVQVCVGVCRVVGENLPAGELEHSATEHGLSPLVLRVQVGLGLRQVKLTVVTIEPSGYQAVELSYSVIITSSNTESL